MPAQRREAICFTSFAAITSRARRCDDILGSLQFTKSENTCQRSCVSTNPTEKTSAPQSLTNGSKRHETTSTRRSPPVSQEDERTNTRVRGGHNLHLSNISCLGCCRGKETEKKDRNSVSPSHVRRIRVHYPFYRGPCECSFLIGCLERLMHM